MNVFFTVTLNGLEELIKKEVKIESKTILDWK